MKEEKKKKKGSVMTTREKMLARKKELEKRSSGGGIIYPKEGTTRVRIKSRGADEELGIEIVQFYLGPKEGGIISPATFDEPCPFMEKFQELKNSDDPDDKALASKLVPKRKYLIGVLGYKDTKGKEIDPDRVDKPMMVPRSVYQDIIDLYLDEEDWGDMTDPVEGYDVKITRTGSGKNDTSYSVSPCQKTKLDKKYRGEVDLEKAIRANILSYEELEEKLASFLNEGGDEDEEDEAPRKESSKSKLADKKKKNGKKYKDDI